MADIPQIFVLEEDEIRAKLFASSPKNAKTLAFFAEGIIALERLMGLVLILIAVQMFLSGLADFMQNQTPSVSVCPGIEPSCE